MVKNSVRSKVKKKTVKRSNKVLQALHLPKVVNLNPRSIYNKVDEFCTFVDEKNKENIVKTGSPISGEIWMLNTKICLIKLKEHIIRKKYLS